MLKMLIENRCVKVLVGSLLLLFLSVFTLTGCSGSDDQSEVIDPDKIVLTVDRKSIIANGIDAVAMKVTRGVEDITSLSRVQIIAIDGKLLDTPISLQRGATEYSTQAPGVYRLQASYYNSTTLYSDNTVDITANDVVRSKYKHKVLAMQFTSVGCVNCPGLSTILKTLKEEPEYSDKFVPVSFHKNFQITDPMAFKFTDTYMLLFGQSGLPAFYLDMRKDANALCVMEPVKQLIDKTLTDYPTMCGIAIESDFNQVTRSGNVNVKITSDYNSSNYKILVYLIENNIQASQYGTSDLFYKHQNVARELLSNSYLGDKVGVVDAGIEKTKKYTYLLDGSWNHEEMQVVACVLNTSDGGTSYYSVNTTTCKLGENIDYLINE